MNESSLCNFVSAALRDILAGVKDAQDHISENGGEIVPKLPRGTHQSVELGVYELQPVEFDLMVTVERGKGSAASIGVLGGIIGGGIKGESSASNQHVNRLKFKIPVRFPTQT